MSAPEGGGLTRRGLLALVPGCAAAAVLAEAVPLEAAEPGGLEAPAPPATGEVFHDGVFADDVFV